MIAPYFYHQEEQSPGVYRLWLAGTDRAGVFRITGSLTVETVDPAGWLAANEATALDELDAGHGAILKIAGRIKQLDRDEATAWQEIRDERDERLAASDWTQITPRYNEAQRDRWEIYREALRNIPQRYTGPYVVVWPDEPTATELNQLALAEDRPASVDYSIDWSEL